MQHVWKYRPKLWQGMGKMPYTRWGMTFIFMQASPLWFSLIASDWSYLQVQHLRDSHLESLLAQYKDINLDHCRIVQNFLSSGRRRQIIHHLEKCPSEEMTRMQEKFQVNNLLITLRRNLISLYPVAVLFPWCYYFGASANQRRDGW